MQPKVSVVMTCYNKEEYVAEMLDSILEQTWDNIELILINDGSTDKTHSIVSEYRTKFVTRGYEFIIVNQENAGVCAAAKAGIKLISGDYVCIIDADDKLHQDYVSATAGWLEDNRDYDYTVCGFSQYKERISEGYFELTRLPKITEKLLLEHYILHETQTMLWAYMLRINYFMKFKDEVCSNYDAGGKGSHEPGFIVPMIAYGGKAKSISKALYLYRCGQEGRAHSQHETLEKSINHISDYRRLIEVAINNISGGLVDSKYKNKLELLSRYAFFFRASGYAKEFGCAERESQYRNAIVVWVKNTLFPDGTFLQHRPCALLDYQMIGIQRILTNDILIAIEDYNDIPASGSIYDELSKLYRLCNHPYSLPIFRNFRPNRIIAYGALGRSYHNLISFLENTCLEPTELWDIAGDGLKIKYPSFDSLSEGDMVLVFPAGKIEEDLRVKFKDAKCRVLFLNELRQIIFPQELFS